MASAAGLEPESFKLGHMKTSNSGTKVVGSETSKALEFDITDVCEKEDHEARQDRSLLGLESATEAGPADLKQLPENSHLGLRAVRKRARTILLPSRMSHLLVLKMLTSAQRTPSSEQIRSTKSQCHLSYNLKWVISITSGNAALFLEIPNNMTARNKIRHNGGKPGDDTE